MGRSQAGEYVQQCVHGVLQRGGVEEAGGQEGSKVTVAASVCAGGVQFILGACMLWGGA